MNHNSTFCLQLEIDSEVCCSSSALACACCVSFDDRHSSQPAAKRVKLPISVIVAWSVTSHSREAGLSKKCQVQAHIALTKAGSIAKENAHQARLRVISP